MKPIKFPPEMIRVEFPEYKPVVHTQPDLMEFSQPDLLQFYETNSSPSQAPNVVNPLKSVQKRLKELAATTRRIKASNLPQTEKLRHLKAVTTETKEILRTINPPWKMAF